LKNNSNFLIILAGLPASGKTTFAIKLKETLELNFQKQVKIIDPDAIRDKSFPESFDFRNEPQIREKNIDLVKYNLIKGYIVISDDLNYYSSMRHDLKLIADELNIKFFIIHISTPLYICLKRNETRGNPIPNEVIENVYNKFDNFNKYKWDTPFDTYALTEKEDINQFTENLSNKIASTLQKQCKSNKSLQIQTTNSIREMLDVITRKFVNELLSNPKYRNSKRKILEYRKSFVKNKKYENPDSDIILEDFKAFLKKNLDVQGF
jgi:O-phosphoseryl-tRNA(Sec) kinase